MELPIDILHYIATYLDCTSVGTWSQSSKFYKSVLSSQLLWRKLFDLYFSVDWILNPQDLDWRQEFIKEFTAFTLWKNTNYFKELPNGTPVVILSRESCGQFVQRFEHIPNFLKYKIHIYEVKSEERKDDIEEKAFMNWEDYDDSDTIQYVIPTDKYTIFPRHWLETCEHPPITAYSPFIIFCSKNRSALRNLGRGIGEQLAHLKKMWKELPEEEKQPFLDTAKQRQIEYDHQKRVWQYCKLFQKNKN